MLRTGPRAREPQGGPSDPFDGRAEQFYYTNAARAGEKHHPKNTHNIMNLALSLAALLALLGLSGGSWYLWSLTPPALIPSGKYIGACAVGLLVVGLVYSLFIRRQRPRLADFASPLVWSFGLVLIFLSAWLCRPYSFFQAPWFRKEIALAAVVAYAMTYTSWRRFLVALPLITSLLSVVTFFTESAGRLLFSDDHAMFIFRLKLLKENFPFIPFWSPLWNGGFDARDFFATGALNAFLIASPLVYLFPIESVYNLIIAGILFALVPGATYAAARLMNAERVVAAVSAVIAMSSSLFWYRWALKYGTIGFVVSTALMPLTIAYLLRFLTGKTLSLRDITLFALIATLTLLWSPSGIALLPLGLLVLPKLRMIVSSRRHLLTAVIILALNLPWMSMMWKVSGVQRFLNSESTNQVSRTTQTEETSEAKSPSTYRHKSEGINLKKSLKNWQESACSANPLVVVLAIPAILSLARPYRLIFGMVSLWLVGLGTVGVSLKPQLELDRMLVVAGVLASFPLATYIVTMFERSSRDQFHRLSASVVGGFLLASPFAIHAMLTNQLYDKYNFAEPEVEKISMTLANTAKDGRGLFTGCVLHELSNGHLAPLPLWSNTPLIASSYAHNIWRYEQPIPAPFLEQGDIGIERFFDLMNVTVVMAHEPQWRKYLQDRPDRYALKEHHKNFMIFERLGYTPSYVLEGEARDLSQTSNSVTLTPLSERIVLKFKYFPFLTASHCTVSPFQVSPDLQLVELSKCRIGESTRVESVSPLKRLFS